MKRTKILVLLVAFILCIFTGCGKGNTAFDETQNNSENETSCLIQAENEASQTQAGNVGETDSGKVFSEKTTAEIAPTTVNKADNKTPSVSTTQSDDKTSAENNEKKLTFSLTISCNNAIAYGKRNESGYDKIIPENGIIYQNASVEFSEGENLLKVLKREMKKNKTVLNVSGEYVRGINGLNEFDCGKYSGWLYKINGEIPNYSMGKCVLSKGCTVEIVYTCVPGDV